ncbi:MAG: hypothetical protein IJ252_01845 [Solobacterium sp.]|nr:hypothetical protein [Solobacterium sp.]
MNTINEMIAYCGVDCERFPCKMMKEFYEENRAHYEAYERMEEYRANKRGEITW